MTRKTSHFEGEMYHVYNRGANRQIIFTCEEDFRRFQLLLHLANDPRTFNFRELARKYEGRAFAEMFLYENPDKSLVNVLGYCLMSNHFHLYLEQKTENGIPRFLQKISTAYSMFFNTKYDRSGVLFQGRYKSKHVNKDPYAQCLFAYIHLNPLEIIEPAWKEYGLKNKEKTRVFLEQYPHSSFYDYCVGSRPERAILACDKARSLFGEQISLENLLSWYVDELFAKVGPLQK